MLLMRSFDEQMWLILMKSIFQSFPSQVLVIYIERDIYRYIYIYIVQISFSCLKGMKKISYITFWTFPFVFDV